MPTPDSSDPRQEEYHRLQQRYRELLSKYQASVGLRTRSHWLGAWLLHHADEGVAFIREGAIHTANRRFYELSGHGRLWSLTHEEPASRGERLTAVLIRLAESLDGEEESRQTVYVRSEQPELCVLEASLQRLAGAPAETAVVLRDTTQAELLRRQSEEAVRRDQVLATVAHELRNPLAPIVSAAELILHAAEDPRITQAAQTILQQARHEARLVEDLLDAARIREGKIALHTARLDLRQPLREAAAATDEHRRAAGVRFELRLPFEPVWVEADPERIVQCAVNLLVNAAKFTPEGGKNRLVLLRIDEAAWVRVEDTGVGIEPAMLRRVFDVFSQGEQSLDRAQGGLGLGLPLVRSLVDLHGGGVRASSPGPGQGAEFAFWLPLAEPPEEVSTPDPKPESASAGAPPPAAVPCRRLLVVEDNRAARETLCDLLEIEGYEVLAAESAPAALDLARRERPDAVISDIGLPGMDGFALAAQLRADLPGTLLIALSGYSQPSEQTHGAEAGFHAYLVKLVDLPSLLKVLTTGVSDHQ